MVDSRQLIPFTFSEQTGQLSSPVDMIILVLSHGQNLVRAYLRACTRYKDVSTESGTVHVQCVYQQTSVV